MDIVAGAAVALVLIPQSLAYAQLAGMPAYRGLYAAAFPPLAAAFFASSPYLQTGPVAITSLLTFGALTNMATAGSSEYVTLGVLLALVVGAVRIAVGLLHAGVVVYLISQPMLLGFLPAAALLIIASQLPAALGVETSGNDILESALVVLEKPEAWDLTAVALSAAVVALVVFGRFIHRLFPSVLVAVLLGVAASNASGYDGATVGPIPTAPSSLSFPLPWHELPELVLAGTVIALVGFIESGVIARTYAAVDRSRWNANREFVSQGVANLAASASGGFPVGGSFSRSALNRLSGARTRWSGAATGVAVLAFLPFADSLSALPTSVLAAVVIGAVATLVRPLPALRLARLSPAQFVVAAATFALTIALSPRIDLAVALGIGIAIAVHLWRELSVEVAYWAEGKTLHVRPHGVLWFGSAARLEEVFLSCLSGQPGASRVVIHLDSLGRIDMTGALALRQLLQDARRGGLSVEVVDVRPRWRGLVEEVIAREDDPLGGGVTRTRNTRV
jgi:SulP family sulfate permease